MSEVISNFWESLVSDSFSLSKVLVIIIPGFMVAGCVLWYKRYTDGNRESMQARQLYKDDRKAIDSSRERISDSDISDISDASEDGVDVVGNDDGARPLSCDSSLIPIVNPSVLTTTFSCDPNGIFQGGDTNKNTAYLYPDARRGAVSETHQVMKMKRLWDRYGDVDDSVYDSRLQRSKYKRGEHDENDNHSRAPSQHGHSESAAAQSNRLHGTRRSSDDTSTHGLNIAIQNLNDGYLGMQEEMKTLQGVVPAQKHKGAPKPVCGAANDDSCISALSISGASLQSIRRPSQQLQYQFPLYPYTQRHARPQSVETDHRLRSDSLGPPSHFFPPAPSSESHSWQLHHYHHQPQKQQQQQQYYYHQHDLHHHQQQQGLVSQIVCPTSGHMHVIYESDTLPPPRHSIADMVVRFPTTYYMNPDAHGSTASAAAAAVIGSKMSINTSTATTRESQDDEFARQQRIQTKNNKRNSFASTAGQNFV